jgi:hypothetical protein
MFKTFLKFALILILAQVVTYFVAGLVAFFVINSSEFYPPSPNALRYLKDPHDPSVQLWYLPAQALRGLLFAVVIFPVRQRILDFGIWMGGLAIAGFIIVMGFIAASGGMIEHFVFFKAADYPLKFAVLTFVEVLIQAALLGLIVVVFDKRMNKPTMPTAHNK